MQLQKARCEGCKHAWIPRVEKRLKCPKCGHILGSRIYKAKGG